MVDFHSHILPEMDDGSTGVGMTARQLSAAKAQGVTLLAATPHFYAESESAADFLARRLESARKLCAAGVLQDAPPVCLGTEVAYYNGVSRMRELHELCIVGTKYLLLEMPFGAWSRLAEEEILHMLLRENIVPVLAHVDRYPERETRRAFDRLADAGCILQLNAEAFRRPLYRRRAYRLIASHRVQALGSDCHNLTSRAMNLSLPAEYFRAKGASELLESLNTFDEWLLKDAERLQDGMTK